MDLLTFHLGDREFGVDLGRVLEIINPPPVTRVPGMPPALLGLIGLRGDPTAVVDAGLRLAGERVEISARTPVVILRARIDGRWVPFGLLVEAAGRRVAVERLLPWSDGQADLLGKDACIGFADLEGRLVLVLDVDRLLVFPPVQPAPPEWLRAAPPPGRVSSAAATEVAAVAAGAAPSRSSGAQQPDAPTTVAVTASTVVRAAPASTAPASAATVSTVSPDPAAPSGPPPLSAASSPGRSNDALRIRAERSAPPAHSARSAVDPSPRPPAGGAHLHSSHPPATARATSAAPFQPAAPQISAPHVADGPVPVASAAALPNLPPPSTTGVSGSAQRSAESLQQEWYRQSARAMAPSIEHGRSPSSPTRALQKRSRRFPALGWLALAALLTLALLFALLKDDGDAGAKRRVAEVAPRREEPAAPPREEPVPSRRLEEPHVAPSPAPAPSPPEPPSAPSVPSRASPTPAPVIAAVASPPPRPPAPATVAMVSHGAPSGSVETPPSPPPAPRRARPVPEAMMVTPDTPACEIHEVRKGDTLWWISAARLGSPYRWPELFGENRAQIVDPDVIEIHDRIRIPGGCAAAPAR